MIVTMQLELRDVPGSLIGALEPVSSHGGNILSVMHSRREGRRVVVQVVFKIGDMRMLELLKKSLRQRNIRATRVSIEGKRYYARAVVDYMLVGHVIDTDLRDTIDRINRIGLVSDIDVVMPSPEDKSSVLLHVEIDEKKAGRLLECMRSVCEEKGFTLVRSLG
jgi:ACT domain-containing protein